MKVLFIETGKDGHHFKYIKGLIDNCKIMESVVYSAVRLDNLNCKVYVHEMIWKNKSFRQYLLWVRELNRIVNIEKPNVIHLLDGDTIMRYMGFGFGKLKKNCEFIITYHHFFEGILRFISYKLMCYHSVIVVHTQEFYDILKKYKIKSINHIEYPAFIYDDINKVNESEAKKYFGLNDKSFVLGAIGATDYYKGLDILIESLKKVNSRVCLFVAGKESNIKKDKLFELKKYNNIEVVTHLKWLSEKEYLFAVKACDCIVLPYRKIFDGASGPLVDGVLSDKVIIGADHGSLGRTIKEHKLGYVFESENVQSLAETIDKCVQMNEIQNEERTNYIRFLNPKRFYRQYDDIYKMYLL